MNPNHHPNSALLMAYASGSLTEAFSLVVASHLSFCQECQQKVNDAEMIGGALIDDLELMIRKIEAAVPDSADIELSGFSRKSPPHRRKSRSHEQQYLDRQSHAQYFLL